MKKRKTARILFVTSSFDPGGAELHLLKLLELLDPAKVESHVIHFAYGELHQRYSNTTAALHYIDKGKGPYTVKLVRTLLTFRKTVQQIDPDVINSQLPETNLLTCFLCGRQYPIVVSERGLGKTRKYWEKLLRKAAYKKASHFIANSPVTITRMIERENIPANLISLVNNIIDVPLASALPALNAEREKDIVSVLAVGGLRKVKGFVHLIRAISILAEQMPGISLTIAGEGPERRSLIELIETLELVEHVKLLGYRKDVTTLLSTADVFVSSSLSEGQSNSILEAMALGIPVVATSVGGTTSLLANGDAGILVPSEDPKALAEGIRRCAVDKHETLQRLEKAIEIIRSNHSPEVIEKQYMAIYDMLSNRGEQLS